MSSVPLSYNASLHPSQLIKARYGNGRISLPVHPNQAIYARFEHVAGVPASEGSEGLSISRLKTIDRLIDRLAHMKQSAESGSERAEIQQLIDSLKSEVEQPGGSVGETVSMHADALHSLAGRGGGGYTPRPAINAALFSMSA